MKTFIFSVVTLIVLAVFTQGRALAAESLIGDISGDGHVNIDDCVMLARHLSQARGAELEGRPLDSADINRDGAVDIKDLVILLQYVTDVGGFAFFELDAFDSGGLAEEGDLKAYIEAGKAYLAAVTAAGDAYDAAADYAKTVFETATEIPLPGDEYNAFLSDYREATNAARELYEAALETAIAVYEEAVER